MSTAKNIIQQIERFSPGKLFTPSIFAGLGSRAAIDQTLMRLNKAGKIQRIGHGLYQTPKINRFGLVAMPTPESVAKIIAEQENALIEVHGAEAARRFGFSTQMPAQPTFYTTGSSRTIKLGNLKVRLQHVAARKLALAGQPAGEALLALWYLGRKHVTPTTFQRIANKISSKEFLALREAKSSMPSWMVESLRQYEAKHIST